MENLKNQQARKSGRQENEDIKMLKKILPTLKQDARIAIHLRFWECMTIQEIAFILGVPWEMADALIEESILVLRERLESLKVNSNLSIAS